MWVVFNNNVTVNMSSVIKFENTTYGTGIDFYCNGLNFNLRFKNHEDRKTANEEIRKAILSKESVANIDVEAYTY